MTDTRSAEKFEYWRRSRPVSIARRKSGQREFEVLIDGEWVARRKLRSGSWEPYEKAKVCRHFEKHLIPFRESRPGLTWRDFGSRFSRTWLGRAIEPDLPGGGGKRVKGTVANLARSETERQLRQAVLTSGEPPSADLATIHELERQSESGYLAARDRNTALEQRASYFLGGAGLTTTLVLANAGLFANETLDSEWRPAILVCLVIGSAFASLAGVRALQASTVTFDRAYADSPKAIEKRLGGDQFDLVLKRTAALIVSSRRTNFIGTWKKRRLSDARTLFLGAGVAIFAATVCFAFAAGG